MKITIEIPDLIANELRLPESHASTALRKEVAYTLYARGIASFGVARRFAEVSKWEFIDGLQERGIVRQFDDEEWEEELRHNRESQSLPPYIPFP